MENILKKICEYKKKFIQKEKEKKNINFLIRNTSKKKKVKDFKIAFLLYFLQMYFNNSLKFFYFKIYIN